MLAALVLAVLAPQAEAVEGVGGRFVVTGRLAYRDGDRLLVDCGRSEPCVETIVRDTRLHRDAGSLQGKAVTLRVRRVARCSDRSSEVACLQASGDTVLAIEEWLTVHEQP